jgi:galactokinase
MNHRESMPAGRVVTFAPGRVNLIGEHTDYNEGLALAFAIREGVEVRAARRDDGRIIAHAVDLEARDEFDAAGQPERVGGWRAFVRGAVGELERCGLPVNGVELEIHGTVPPGGGLASSAALELSLCLALLTIAGHPRPAPLELARICSRIESNWVGVRTGLLDQLASIGGREGCALRIDFESLSLETVPLELDGWRLVTLDSGETHDLSESGYNVRRAECEQACRLLGITSLRHAVPEQAARLPSPLAQRARHVITENARVDAAVAALARGDLARLGSLLDESHASLRDLYEVSTPAVEEAVERLRAAGAIGARIIGGGFGGHVLGLFPPAATPPLASREVVPGRGAGLLSSEPAVR